MTEISGNDDDVVLTYNGDIDVSGEDQAEHDAAAAHALKKAIDNRMQRAVDADRLQEQVVLGGLLGYADEIMRTWGFDPEAGKP